MSSSSSTSSSSKQGRRRGGGSGGGSGGGGGGGGGNNSNTARKQLWSAVLSPAAKIPREQVQMVKKYLEKSFDELSLWIFLEKTSELDDDEVLTTLRDDCISYSPKGNDINCGNTTIPKINIENIRKHPDTPNQALIDDLASAHLYYRHILDNLVRSNNAVSTANAAAVNDYMRDLYKKLDQVGKDQMKPNSLWSQRFISTSSFSTAGSGGGRRQ